VIARAQAVATRGEAHRKLFEALHKIGPHPDRLPDHFDLAVAFENLFPEDLVFDPVTISLIGRSTMRRLRP
jgi:hypothetical protein